MISPVTYITTLRAHWIALLSLAVAGLLLGAFGGRIWSAEYTANRLLAVSSRAAHTWTELGEVDLLAKRHARTLAYIGNSASTRDVALRRIRVDPATAMACRISTAVPVKTAYLAVSATAPNRDVAVSLAQAVADDLMTSHASLSPALSTARAPILTVSDATLQDHVVASRRPQWMLPALGGLALPFLAYCGFVLWGAARPTVGRSADLEDVLPFPVLGSVPHGSGVGASARNTHRGYVEALTRAGITQRRSGRCRVIALTQINGPSDCNVAVSLGESLASFGRRVLVVDADMGSPSMDPGTDRGLVTLLREERASPADLLRWSHPLLAVLPTEPLTSGTRLLLDGQTASVFSRLRSHADFVFVSTPSALSGPDASILADLSDEVILLAGIDTRVDDLIDAGLSFREGSIRGLLMVEESRSAGPDRRVAV